MYPFFQNVLTASFHGSIVILAVLALRLVLRRTPKKFICWLWMLAGVRLLMPIPLQSPFSLQPKAISIPIDLDLSAFLPIVWVAVALVIGGYSVGSYLHLRGKVLDAVKIPGGWESDKIDTAFVLGFMKPRIYIPTGMPDKTKAQILAHERTHLDKGDHWIKVIGFLALALHWFNPLVWVSYILLCKDIEMACDERVVQFMELEERKAYSSALLRCSTKHPHYAACPVAFGEVSVKYRIKSVLHYKKPSFWLSLLGILAICFVAVCLMTSPEKTVEVLVDPDAQLQENSKVDPADLAPVVAPALDPNPDWGVEVLMDAASPTGGRLVYIVEERFAAASGNISMRDGTIDRWNGEAWEPMPSQSGQSTLFEAYRIGFAQSRDRDVSAFSEDLDWTLYYGALPAGDYRIRQTIESDTDAAVFQTGFHIYREQLSAEGEAALDRCTAALDRLYSSAYDITFSELDPEGTLSPVRRLVREGNRYLVEHYLGEYCISSAAVDYRPYPDWDQPYRLDQNRRFLFPEGQSVISQEEVTFCSAWEDYLGTSHRGKDTYLFYEDGRLRSADRLIQTLDEGGNVIAEDRIRLEAAEMPWDASVEDVGKYAYEDSYEAMAKSPWDIYFRVDDDYLNPSGGEVWITTDAVGVVDYTTDGSYWLEKKVGVKWERLGDKDTEASWGQETIQVMGRTASFNVDWTEVYGQLEPGVYRMGKRFYSGDESTIQYAEFAIYQTGGICGEGGEEALARVDAALEKLQQRNYRVEQQESSMVPGREDMELTRVIWKYGDILVYDYYNDASQYSHSGIVRPEDNWRLNWWVRVWDDAQYGSVYFPQGYGLISDREIRFAQTYSRDAADDPSMLLTYRFDENGDLTEVIQESRGGMWDGYVTRWVITDTPESDIQAWVEAKLAEE